MGLRQVEWGFFSIFYHIWWLLKVKKEHHQIWQNKKKILVQHAFNSFASALPKNPILDILTFSSKFYWGCYGSNFSSIHHYIICQKFLDTWLKSVLLFFFQPKCDLYWPDSGTETYGDMLVSLLREDILASYTLRTFSIRYMKPNVSTVSALLFWKRLKNYFCQKRIIFQMFFLHSFLHLFFISLFFHF